MTDISTTETISTINEYTFESKNSLAPFGAQLVLGLSPRNQSKNSKEYYVGTFEAEKLIGPLRGPTRFRLLTRDDDDWGKALEYYNDK